MGQKKIKTINLDQNAEDAKSLKNTSEVKKKSPKNTSEVTHNKNIDKSGSSEVEGLEKAKKKKPKKVHSRRYRILRTKIDRKKLYPIKKAVELLLKISNARLDETIEIHIITHDNKVTGSVSLPHGTGKKQKVVIADEKLIEKVAKGKIDFDILIAEPEMMSKIAKVAKILGPKGLMPNPKTGTISDKPKKLKKKLEKGETRFKTEAKFPLLHIVIGKISFGEKKILENIEALIKAIDPRKIKKAVLTSTHSPGIILEINT